MLGPSVSNLVKEPRTQETRHQTTQLNPTIPRQRCNHLLALICSHPCLAGLQALLHLAHYPDAQWSKSGT